MVISASIPYALDSSRCVILCLPPMILAQQNLEPVVAYLKGIGGIYHFSELDDDGLALFAIDLFSHASDNELNTFTDPATTPFPKSLLKAQGLVHKWRAKQWTFDKNRDGHKLATSVVHMHAERELKRVPSTMRPESWGPPGTHRSTMLMSRLRAKYNGRFGQLPVVCELGKETMRAKASAVWQWYDFYSSQRPTGKAILHIN